MQTATTPAGQPTTTGNHAHHHRFHLPHAHLSSAFGGDWFGLKAEGFARFFGTPTFLIGQSFLVAVWIVTNAAGVASRQELASRQSAQVLELLEQNTALTKVTQELSQRIAGLTAQIHESTCRH